MPAQKFDITVEQGATYKLRLRFWADAEKTTPEDLTGVNFRMQIRLRHETEEWVWEGTLIGELGPNGISYVDSDPEGGEIEIEIPASATEDFEPVSHVYDLERIDGDEVQRVIEGRVWVKPEVTR